MAESCQLDTARSRSPASDPNMSKTESSTITTIKSSSIQRKSVFVEIGLEADDLLVSEKMQRESLSVPPAHRDHFDRLTKLDNYPVAASHDDKSTWTSAFPVLKAILVACTAIALWSFFPAYIPQRNDPGLMVEAGAIEHLSSIARVRSNRLLPRQDSSTDVCKRWAHMSAIVNGTLYVYGGQATTSPDQTQNAWNNDFLSLDLTKTWQIGSPSLTSEARPSQLPAVSLGTLWQDLDSLYLYGGQFSWQPPVSPVANALWQYSIPDKSWKQHSNLKDVSGQAVERAAEGAGVSVPNLGRGLYLGGHLDGYTTEGWSQSVPRVYLQSTLEYTMPGFVNSAISKSSTGADGAFRNLTADSAGFPQRADGVLVYVPGYGASGIIVALAGGTNTTFSQMNVIDVYDIATSKWYRQATTGPTPQIRVNPCAIAVSAMDGSSTEIYMYGGQNLQPALNQTQYDDMWILTVPSFTWIEVDQSQQSKPPARAGHTCNVWNGQMVVVGGYVDQQLSCDSPGIYVFNTSSLSWQNQYSALEVDDPLNRQPTQQGDQAALQGSYGYLVPVAVQEKIGGNAEGGATATAPAQYPTAGPMVSGKPHTYSTTGTGVAAATATAAQPGQSDGNSSNPSSSGHSGGPNAGAIAAGVVAAVLAIVAAYLGFCAWVYRRQLKVYKYHVAMVQRESLSNDPTRTGLGVPVLGVSSHRYSDKDQSSDTQQWSVDNHSGVSADGGTTPSSTDKRSYINSGRRHDLGSNNPYRNVPGGNGYATAHSSTDDLLRDHEPSFLGVVLNPRQSLRVVNKD